MISKTEIDRINKQLEEDYGFFFGRPKMKLVWSDDQFETRTGEVNIFYGSIFVRTEKGSHYLPKYTNIKERWVLEGLSEGWNAELNKELSYEPVWTFQNSLGEYQDPVYRAIKVIVYSLMNPTRLSPNSMRDLEKEEYEKEIKFFEEYLSGEMSYTASMLGNGEAVTVPEMPK